MWTRHFIAGRKRLTSVGFGVIVLCVLPFLFDVALCDKFAAAPLLEPTVVDVETADPSEPPDDSVVSDCQFGNQVPYGEARDFGKPASLEPGSAPSSCLLVVSLTSRPPPIS